jgi:hypothetical protein
MEFGYVIRRKIGYGRKEIDYSRINDKSSE